jgi:ABC-2 type transport system ATP-binding protein/sodium transport system ATP-binding protein
MITAANLHKTFVSRNRKIAAVQDVSFEVGAGEVYGLLGPNGAGKTTTLRMIMGLLVPDSGTVTVGGVGLSAGQHNLRRQLSLISTNDGCYPYLTVYEVLAYFADLYDVPPDTAGKRIRELAELLGFGSYLDQRCNSLSTGQRQRVILARGLMHDPPAILLDEPTRGLDVVGSRTIFQFIQALRQQGKAILLSTHRLDEAERVCDRFGLLYGGKVQLEGTLAELTEKSGREHLVDMFIDLIDGKIDSVPAC